jgi:hypothetical protein
VKGNAYPQAYNSLIAFFGSTVPLGLIPWDKSGTELFDWTLSLARDVYMEANTFIRTVSVLQALQTMVLQRKYYLVFGSEFRTLTFI